MDLEKIIENAYELYMPQLKDEIKDLASFVQKQKPSVIVEIGTKYGGTFMIWNEISDGLKISIDLTDGIHGGVSHDDVVNRDNFFKKKYGENCVFINGNSHDISTYEKLLGILNGKKIDFLFIDGDHTYEGVKSDFNMYNTLVKKGGHIAFHDINDSENHRKRNVYVCQLWQELNYDKIEFNSNEDWGGIGIIKV